MVLEKIELLTWSPLIMSRIYHLVIHLCTLIKAKFSLEHVYKFLLKQNWFLLVTRVLRKMFVKTPIAPVLTPRGCAHARLAMKGRGPNVVGVFPSGSTLNSKYIHTAVFSFWKICSLYYMHIVGGLNTKFERLILTNPNSWKVRLLITGYHTCRLHIWAAVPHFIIL